MLIGLVGKPSSGKSTFFKASTLADVLIASYPFATIEPNQGVAYVKINCICKELNTQCTPVKGYCTNKNRFVPIDLLDVAGLVKGASEGKGLGNKFLDNLTSADAFIHIVDVSGETDSQGKQTKDYDPSEDIAMLEEELDMWYFNILSKVWKSFFKKIQIEKMDFSKAVATQFSGLKVNEDDVKQVLLKGNYDPKIPTSWTNEQIKKFSHDLRHLTKPMIIAANKSDKPNANENIEKIKELYPNLKIIPCSSDSELALREAHNAKLIEYIPGENDFKITGEVNDKQKAALNSIKENVLKQYNSTGIQEILNFVVFTLLKYKAIFPAGSKLKDSKGNILADCFLLPQNATALDFAYFLHTDIGDNFIKAIDVMTKQAVGKDHVLKHRDGIEIMVR